MKFNRTSVQFRVLMLGVGLFVVLGSAILLLEAMVARQVPQLDALHMQSRRFGIIEAVGRSMDHYREVYSHQVETELTNAPVPPGLKAEIEEASAQLNRNLDKMAAFDPEQANVLRTAIRETPIYSNRLIEIVKEGRPESSDDAYVQLQKRKRLIESTLQAVSAQEHARAEEIHAQEAAQARAAYRYSIVLLLVSGLGAVVLSIVVARSIIKPLQGIATAIRLVNTGATSIDLPRVGADEFGQIALALRQFRDSSEYMRRVAFEDPITGIGNRTMLLREVSNWIAHPDREPFGLLYIDLDNFRSVNDRLGHSAGDQYLREAASRLARFVPQGSVLCRFGGDKFTVLFRLAAGGSEHSRQQELQSLADVILRALSEPCSVGTHNLAMSCSIGIAAFPEDATTTEQLVSAADAAAFAAKKSGRRRSRFAASEVAAKFRRNLSRATEIYLGLERSEFEPYYQPIVDIDRGKVVAAEALLRWNHPSRGLLLPGEFIEAAEESGLIGRLGEQCLVAAYEQNRRWRQGGDNLNIRMAVNVSARQINDGDILSVLPRLEPLSENDPGIDFELTESLLLESSDRCKDTLEAISQRGFRLGLDDFGTGYSSFSYLRRFRIDKLKIDRQFVMAMNESREADEIVTAIIAMARALNLEVVAEGVESVDQSWSLRRKGCVLQQGWYFAKAMAAADFIDWARNFEASGVGKRIGPVLTTSLQ
jgi:diguanylate cyclase (GGDEF)-like protein